MLKLAPAQPPLSCSSPPNGNTYPWRLPRDARSLCDRFCRNDNATRDKSSPAFVLARKDEDRVALRDMLASIHHLLRRKHERPGRRITNLGFDRESKIGRASCRERV